MTLGRRTMLSMAACALTMAASAYAGAPAVWTEHNDNFRSGDNLTETILTPTNVNGSTFGRLWTVNLDDQAFSQPLYVPGRTIDHATHNVVYATTVNDSVYAIDADTGTILWHTNLLIKGDSVPSNAQASQWGACGGQYTDFTGKFGIVGTPVIDTTTGTLYVVARSYSGATYIQQLHALNILTGAEVDGGPATISGTYNESTWSPQLNNQRPALTLVNGTVYIAWSSHCDFGSYNGFVMGYNASNLTQQYIWADTSQGGSLGGIWQAGQGISTDRFNNLYLMTGNGTWDGTANFGESFVKLSTSLDVLDYFTPSDWNNLNGGDMDLGSAGALVIPGTGYVFGGGKQGMVYLLNTHNMGHENNSDQVVQEFQATFPSAGNAGFIHGSPVYFNNGADQYVYVWGENDYLRCFEWRGTSFDSTAVATSVSPAPAINSGEPGGFMSVSANGTNDGIVWALTPYNGDANQSTVEGILHAYAATPDGTTMTELWNTKQNATRDDFGNYGKDSNPTVANGKVYVSTFGSTVSGSGSLVCYGLLYGSPPIRLSGLTATSSDGSVLLSWTQSTQATSYNVYRGTTSGSEGATPIAAGITTTTYRDMGVTNGTTYYYTIAGVNAAGTSAPSGQAYAEPTATSPVQVDMSSAYNVSGIYTDGTAFSGGGFDGDGDAYSANLLGSSTRWNGSTFIYGPANGPDAVSSIEVALPSGRYSNLYMLGAGVNGAQNSQAFMIKYSDGSSSTFAQSLSDWFAPQNFVGESEVVSCSYRDSNDGTENQGPFYVYGYNFPVDGAKTVRSVTLPINQNVVVLAMDLIPTVPATPCSDLAATGGDKVIGLSWAPGANATSFNIYRGMSSGGESSKPIATGVLSTTFTDTGLTNGTRYYYAVKSVDPYGSSRNSNEASAMPTEVAPPAPTGLTATAVNSAIQLSWSPSFGATSYNVYRGAESNDESSKPIGTGIGSTEYTDSTVSNGISYYYVVKAVNSAGASKNSNQATTATPQ